MYTRILLATDGAASSQLAAQHAIALADVSGAQLLALRVVPPYASTYLDGGMALTAADIENMEQQWKHEAMESLLAIKSLAQRQQVRVKPLVVMADEVASTVVQVAKRHKCDLIVMASHGRRGLKRLLMGSETQEVLALARTPVLVVRA